MTKFAHVLIVKTAKGMAAAFYEEAARDDMFYRAWPSQRNYVRAKYSLFIPHARETLVLMLGMDDCTETMKETIFEAIMLDRTLPEGGDVTAAPPSR